MADPTVVVVQDLKAPFAAIAANGADFVWVAGTPVDGDVFACTGRELLLVRNTDVGNQTVLVVSTDDENSRSEDIGPYTLGAGESAAFGVGLTNSKGWKNSSGQIRVTVSDATVELAVLRLPAGFP